jgi:hypothetical protein
MDDKGKIVGGGSQYSLPCCRDAFIQRCGGGEEVVSGGIQAKSEEEKGADYDQVKQTFSKQFCFLRINDRNEIFVTSDPILWGELSKRW